MLFSLFDCFCISITTRTSVCYYTCCCMCCWSRCNNTRSKVHDKCNALESSQSHPLTSPIRGKLSSVKPGPGARSWGGRCRKRESKELLLSFLGSPDETVDFKLDSVVALPRVLAVHTPTSNTCRSLIPCALWHSCHQVLEFC